MKNIRIIGRNLAGTLLLLLATTLASPSAVFAISTVDTTGTSSSSTSSSSSTGTCSNGGGTNGLCYTCTPDSTNPNIGHTPENKPCVPDGVDPAATNAACNAGACDLVKTIINPAINVLSALVAVVAVISIILAGIQYSTSAGDPQKAAKARARIFNVVIALVVYLFFYAFFQFLIPGGFLHAGTN